MSVVMLISYLVIKFALSCLLIENIHKKEILNHYITHLTKHFYYDLNGKPSLDLLPN